MRMVVVLPAPFGPRKPRTSPFSTRNETPSTAVVRPYLLVRLSTSIIRPFLFPELSSFDAAGGSPDGGVGRLALPKASLTPGPPREHPPPGRSSAGTSEEQPQDQ